MSKEKTVSLPEKLYKEIEKRVESAGFTSVDEYVIFILEEVVGEESTEQSTSLSSEDEENIKKQLKSLGYLD